MFLWFALLVLVLVVAVFALLVGLVFDPYPQAATASILYVTLALLFGVYLYQLGLPFIPGTVVFVSAVLVKAQTERLQPYYTARSMESTIEESENVMVINPAGGNVVIVGSLGASENEINCALR